MCGILGVSGKIKLEAFKEAQIALAHRGPDDRGIYRDLNNDINLAHVRLSIIDLSKNASQPMRNADGTIIIIFNGEIYNFKALRKILQKRGFNFKGKSDTEVILRAYEAFGDNLFSKLQGMFAIAIWDKKLKKLLIGRDAFGVKPLYYFEGHNRFIFSSEIKSMISLIDKNAKIDSYSIARYLNFLWCPGDGTGISGLKKLGPGEYIWISKNRIIDHQRWFDPSKFPKQKLKLVQKDVIKKFEQLMRSAVQSQMTSDVPVGALLSGGLDSSTIVAFAKNYNPNIQCFTIGIKGMNNQEFAADQKYACKVAKFLNVPLETVTISPEMLANSFSDMIYQLDEPLADPSALNVKILARCARDQGVKVLLSGIGGDDLFTGYRRHSFARAVKALTVVPPFMWKVMASSLKKFDSHNSLVRRLEKANEIFLDNEPNKNLLLFLWGNRNTLESLFSKKLQSELKNFDLFAPMREFLNESSFSENSIDQLLSLDQRFFLADHNLIFNDKMSMAEGVEMRVPFLDLDLVRFSQQLPPKFKQNGIHNKWIIKKAMEPHLPRDVIYRKKTGFGVPLRLWFNSSVNDLVYEVLSKKNLKSRGLFDPDEVHRLIKANANGEFDYSYTVYSLLCIEVWCQKFID